MLVYDIKNNFTWAKFKKKRKDYDDCLQIHLFGGILGYWQSEQSLWINQKAFNILTTELGTFILKQSCLHIAIKVLNNITKPNGLVLMLLVFGAYIKVISQLPLSITIIESVFVIEKTTKALRIKAFERQVQYI